MDRSAGVGWPVVADDQEMFRAELVSFACRLAATDDPVVLRRIALCQFLIRQGAHALARQTAAMEDARALREASHAVSGALDWSAQAGRPSHAELTRRRGEAA